MLLSLVFILRPVSDLYIPMTLGKAVHACFLRLVNTWDERMGTRLHGTDPHKPFTTSPLQGPFIVRDQQLLLRHDQAYWLRVTSLEPRLSRLLLAIEEQPPQCINLLGAKFTVTSVSSHPRDHAWARRSSYEELHTVKLLSDARSRARVKMAFVSPTAFRSQSRTILLPLPHLVFASLLDKWNRYAPFPLDTGLIGAIDAGVDISRYELATKMMDFDDYRQLGFVGDCTFIARSGASEEAAWGLQVLAAFAFFAGVGYKTTMGMGQAKQVGERL